MSIVRVVKEGGVDGVIVINIVLGLMGLKFDGIFWLVVGIVKWIIYGGVFGIVIRFIVLRVVIFIVCVLFGFFILVIGGIDFVESGF